MERNYFFVNSAAKPLPFSDLSAKICKVKTVTVPREPTERGSRRSYLVARCAGGADDEYPFISTDAGTTVDDIVECRCDHWMPLAECRRGGEGA